MRRRIPHHFSHRNHAGRLARGLADKAAVAPRLLLAALALVPAAHIAGAISPLVSGGPTQSGCWTLPFLISAAILLCGTVPEATLVHPEKPIAGAV
jgi:hypothetical protein